MTREQIRCTECEHCKNYGKRENTRGSFYCEHPDQEYIYEYWNTHRIHKMQGFVGFGEKFADKPNIKTSPAWCPRKKAGAK